MNVKTKIMQKFAKLFFLEKVFAKIFVF